MRSSIRRDFASLWISDHVCSDFESVNKIETRFISQVRFKIYKPAATIVNISTR